MWSSPFLGSKKKCGRNAGTRCSCVGVWYACVCARRRVQNCINVPSRALYAYVSFLSAFVSIFPANLSISACVERAQHFSVWVAGICLSIALAFSLYFYVCLSARLPVRSVCRKKPSLSAERLPTERTEKPISLC